MRAWSDVAILAKMRRHDGRFVAKAATGLPFVLKPGDEVRFVPPRIDVRRSALVESVEDVDYGTAEIVFRDVRDPDEMRELLGMHCLVKGSKTDRFDVEELPLLWEGFELVDSTRGLVGVVAGVVENPAHDLLEIERDGATVLVPVVDEFVLSVDTESRVVNVSLPDGLLDL